jgi:hypothetical protein
MGSDRGASCDTCTRSLWTGCYVATWGLLAVGTIVCHMAIANLIDPLKALPENVHKGFYEVLGFDSLAADSEVVRESAENAMDVCGATAADCRQEQLPTTTDQKDTSSDKAAILGAFDRSLAKIEKVANDEYFGTAELQETARQLDEITQELEQLDTDQCRVTNEAYCKIYLAADGLVAGARTALDAVDQLADSDQVKTFEENSDRLVLLHAMPYVLLLSMLFFFCFWKKDAACCCCGGSLGGCVALVLHLLLWLVFLIISLIIVVIAWTFKFGQDKIELTGQFNNDPTLEQLLNHIETSYPEFWKLVIVPLEQPLDQFYTAAFLFLMFCILISFYGCCLCLCRPYTDRAEK